MDLNAGQCYAAVRSRDARFDGRFFVAVKTTRIYCRAICRVKTPLEKNCTFYPCAAAAEGAGYRPCKRCRPELAPGQSLMEAGSHLARMAAYHIGQDFLAGRSLAELAEKIGVSERQMRRAFHGAFGVSPVAFWQTQRLLMAKQLLTDSRMPVTAVALASGFQSVRRFNALLKARYRMTPTELRRRQKGDVPEKFPEFAFRLSYRPPLAWEMLLEFLAKRAIPEVETVRDGAYLRTVRVERHGKTFAGHIEVRHVAEEQVLSVRLSGALLPVCAALLERVKRVFDLHADPAAIEAALGVLMQARRGLRVPGSFDGFETAVRAVLGQQVSMAAARTLTGRLAARFGDAIETPEGGLARLFPAAARIAAATVDDIGQLGITGRRARTLIALAGAVVRGDVSLDPGHPVEGTMEQLRAIPGIGEWTTQYIAMWALSWPDAFPHTDLWIRRAMREEDPAKILEQAERWRPWRAYAALHLWTGLERAS